MWLFHLLFYLGIIIMLYYCYKAYQHWVKNESLLISLIHIFIVGPLSIYIGYNKDKTSRKLFEALIMLGFAAIGYHSYLLYMKEISPPSSSKA